MTEQEQRDHIINDIERCMFVEAGAGAGKTTLIVQRVLHQLACGKVRPEELVIITFTNKAAVELRERIGDGLIKRSEQVEDSQEKQNLKTALADIDRMNISTIHSFCKKLLKERIFDAELRMDMEVMEEEEHVQRQQAFFEQQYQNLSTAELKNLSDHKIAMKQLELAFYQICELPADTSVYCKSFTAATEPDIETEAKVFLNQFWQDVVDAVNQEKKTAYSSLDELVEKKIVTESNKSKSSETLYMYYGECKGGLLTAETALNKIALSNTPYFKGSKLDAVEKQLKKKANDKKNELKQQMSKYKSRKEKEDQQEQYNYMMELADRFRKEYQKHPDSRYLSNDQLLQRTLQLVQKEEARAFFATKYKCIYVDEFQDTDHVQAQIIRLLCTGEAGRFRAGALFVVGDPKQSIYRFRGADLYVYEAFKKNMSESEDADVYELSENYRSRKEIVQWVNDNFYDKFSPYRPMEAKRACVLNDEDILKGVYRCAVDECDENGMSLDEDEKQTETVCRLVENLLLYGQIEDDGKKRKAEPQDILILTWGKAELSEYQFALERKGIPVCVTGNVDLSVYAVVNRFVRLYGYLAYPWNRLKKTGALEVLASLEVADEEQEAMLQYLRKQTDLMDGMGKALYLMQHEEYLYERGQKYSEADLLSYRTMLEQITETVCAQTMNSTQNIAAAMEEYVDTTLENQLVLQHQFKAVRMMNLHKAKGLEGNIVIVPDRKKEISFKQGTVQIVESGKRVSVVSIRMGKGIKYGYVLGEALENLAQKEERADRIRLEYVEVTRAREAFIVMDSDVDQCLFSDQYTLSDCPEIFSKLKKAVEQEDNSCQTAATTERVEKRCFPSSDVQILEEQQKKCYIDITPSMFETNGSAEKKKYLLEGQEPQKEERIKGNVFGTMMHRAIELFVQKWRDNRQAGTDVLQKLADQSICRAIMENQDDLYKKEHCENEEDYLKQAGAYHKALAGALRSFYADAHIKTLVLNAEAVHTEMPFSFITTIKAEREKKGEQNLFTAMKVYLEHEKIDIEDGQEVWIHGICDLVAEQQDGSIAIVDYKSDTKDSLENEQFHEYLNKKYEGQMTLYKYALEHIYPDREVEMPRLWSLYEEAAEES